MNPNEQQEKPHIQRRINPDTGNIEYKMSNDTIWGHYETEPTFEDGTRIEDVK